MDSWNRNPSLGKARLPPLLAKLWYLVLHLDAGHRRQIVIAASGKNRNVNRAAAIAGST
jgi:hypothetical protein